jgi:hypothetical protein
LHPDGRDVARVLVFTGHRIDAPERESPRFPTQAADEASRLIRAAVSQEKERANAAAVVGFAGGASGGDIIFHEQCEAVSIPTTVMLALPPRRFAARSVDDAGPEWTARFDRICDTHPVRVLADATDADADDLWQRTNLWILDTAGGIQADANTLIAFWDGSTGDGPGGTEEMVRAAHERGFGVLRLDAKRLLHNATSSGDA